MCTGFRGFSAWGANSTGRERKEEKEGRGGGDRVMTGYGVQGVQRSGRQITRQGEER